MTYPTTGAAGSHGGVQVVTNPQSPSSPEKGIKPHVAHYGRVKLHRVYCPQCQTNTLVLKGIKQCCGETVRKPRSDKPERISPVPLKARGLLFPEETFDEPNAITRLAKYIVEGPDGPWPYPDWSLVQHESLRKLDAAGIYAVTIDAVLVYVGQSRDIANRSHQHCTTPWYQYLASTRRVRWYVRALGADQDTLDRVERFMIEKGKPEMNRDEGGRKRVASC